MLRLQNKPRVRPSPNPPSPPPHTFPLYPLRPPNQKLSNEYYTHEIRCYTVYCPSQTWKFEDRGTQCGPIPTLAAQFLTASPSAHPTPVASDGSKPAAAAAAAASSAGAVTATPSAAAATKSGGSHSSSSGPDGVTLGMGASSSAGAVISRHSGGGGIFWVVVVGLWGCCWGMI